MSPEGSLAPARQQPGRYEFHAGRMTRTGPNVSPTAVAGDAPLALDPPGNK